MIGIRWWERRPKQCTYRHLTFFNIAGLMTLYIHLWDLFHVFNAGEIVEENNIIINLIVRIWWLICFYTTQTLEGLAVKGTYQQTPYYFPTSLPASLFSRWFSRALYMPCQGTKMLLTKAASCYSSATTRQRFSRFHTLISFCRQTDRQTEVNVSVSHFIYAAEKKDIWGMRLSWTWFGVRLALNRGV